ncbi:hypothetical protein [Nostoc sp. PA-18-2419]|uniref:hypothetical protein n=1 Tax=Nostoc sp. PA-18-2419 TaxID=2575443 RepID=UPI0011096DA8|nr:hypothetical protein [Nostoc sp. PA-18-2419]
MFNENLYRASLRALVNEGVPVNVAVKASEVVAKDEAGKPELGRTSSDQQAVQEAMKHYWAGRINAD